MTLKNATLVAIVGVIINLIIWLGQAFGIFGWSSTLSIIQAIALNGGLFSFLIVLYLKQK